MIFLDEFLGRDLSFYYLVGNEKSHLAVILEYRVYDSLGSFVLMRETMTSHVAAKP